jgi:probable F420-dependent oxidoreductase
VRFGVVIPSYGPFGAGDAFLPLVRAAEDLGYDGAWFSDHVAIPDYATDWIPLPQLEPLALCCVGLGATSRLRFGVDVLVAAYRHPLVLATTAATAGRVSGGRLTLGIGVGYLEGEFAALGLPYQRRGALADEAIEIIRSAWEQPGPIDHDGPYWSYRDVHAGSRPPQGGGVPLWVGGNARAALERAATVGDGWHPLWMTPPRYREARDWIMSRRAEAGLDRPFAFSFSCPRTVLLPAARDWQDDAVRPRPSASRPEYGYVPAPPRAEDGRPRFTGTCDEVSRDVEAYAAAGVEHLTVRPWTSASDLSEQQLIDVMGEFSTEVASRFTDGSAVLG